MKLKYSKTLLEAQDIESPIADICWSPNNVKLAVATCDRLVLLFDREGTRRDKFATKPADPAAGKKSYVITNLSFSENSDLLGVAQSDNMVFVYRVGADWSGKKVICNKFPLTGAPISLDCKSNKSSSMWTGGACCVSLARGGEGTLASGHVDGTLYLNGRLLLRYALPPTALVLLPPYMLAFGVFDGCLVGELKESGGVELSMLNIPNFYASRALAWSGDGTKLALASQTGAVIQLEAVLRRWVWRDSVEVQHIPWSGSGERVYAAVGGACLLHRAGELSVVEYGLDKVLHTVRTERVNPHVLSVRINEGATAGAETGDRKHLAYLLDRQTIAVVDLTTGLNNALVRARLAIFEGDLSAAEECYVRRASRPDLAVNMYKMFNKWTEAIALAERTDRASVATLKQQHMDYLTSTGRLGEAGAVLASSGDVQGAVRLWLRGGRSRRAAALLLLHPQLLRDTDLLDAVHTQLIQEEWWETAGEISERKGDTRAAVEYYAKGNNYARAVQLAREACPGEVTRLEGEWGAWLVSGRQAGAAVPHLIEAGQPRAALDAALAAHHHRKALQILQAIDDKESIREQCEKLGDHFISTREWETAERVLVSCGMSERCVRAYNSAGRVADGLRLAAAQLSEEQTRDIYMPLAQQLRQDGQLRKAEQIYIGLGEPDEAISMYKEIGKVQYRCIVQRDSGRALNALRARMHPVGSNNSWDIAMELCSLGGGMTRSEVARAEAAALAEERPEEAEAAFLRAGAAEHAVRMWVQHGKHHRALALAEQHAPALVEEVLVEGAKAAAERGDLPQFETLMIRANRPREVVQHYKDLGK
ncbi:hypothetical protein HF086_016158 [Spodoptera exigua]|uniref:Intraflagellar transport protein 172 homolog n=1 Tax=Spodoptera exigua TaxID=7107 RepID=A0A922MHW6_SPOEX|nr:hypothetical protein HF086_016158 [Spodoptera exigua]